MKRLVFLLLFLTTLNLHGNIQYIGIRNIPDYEKYSKQFIFLAQNFQYFNHWVPEWTYDVNKDSLVIGLKDCYETFAPLDSNNIEINLLLGDISHYLYNLNEEDYNDDAINYYNKAHLLGPDDFRSWWFIGNHYSFSANQPEAVKNFLYAHSILPKKIPADFWNEFAHATAIANMPSDNH